MSSKRRNLKKIIGIATGVLGAAFVGMKLLAYKKKDSSVYNDSCDDKNPFEGKKVIFVKDEADKENADGVRGHLEAVGTSEFHQGFYDKYIKRALDVILSFGGLVVLSPVFAVIAIAIKIEDPGPVLFTQKRIGQNKQFFKLHKFRSMKMCTPHDVPTHMLDNPEQYITKVGKFIRAHSLDELPQIWDIFIGNMSVIGPRPALWNQDILTAERDKYGANDVKPGLTGWAQINGRDELEIPVKARLDGEYVQKESLLFDAKCFFGTVSKVGHDDSVVEGGTGAMQATESIIPLAECESSLDYIKEKRVLIAGTGSYIGEEFKKFVSRYESIMVDSFDTRSDEWLDMDFSKYDVVYDVAGIAHIKETDENRHLYYEVNRDLAVKIANKAKKEGVKQFIYLSSMSVYGLTVGVIDENTAINPVNAYGKSKAEAEKLLWQLNDESFIVSIVRPPMVYGNGCKGNYQMLRKFALKVGVFPDYDNERSMIYIDNLSSAIVGILYNQKAGIYLPQNVDYVKTYDMVKKIAKENGKKVINVEIVNPVIKIALKKIEVFKKVFGTLVYTKRTNVPIEWLYENNPERWENITESEKKKNGEKLEDKKSVLILMSTYNGEKYIEAQIDSIMNQKTEACVVLRIRDDGSTDSTCNIIKEKIKEYPNRIELIEGKNKGYNVSFFELIRSAENFDYYAFSDQDDVWLEEKIQTAIEYIDVEEKNLPLLYASTSYLVDDSLKPYGTTRKKQKEFTIYNTLIQNICPGHTQVMNNELFELLKKDIDVSRIYVYDSWITNTAMLYGKILFDNKSHTYYRQHRENQLGSGNGKIGQLISSVKKSERGGFQKYKMQIKYFAEKNEEALKKIGAYNDIVRFVEANTVIKKILYINCKKMYRQNWIETVAFYVAFIYNK